MTSPKPLLLWPGVIAAALIVLLKLCSLIVPDAEVWGILGGVAGGAIIIIWWLFFSRAAWSASWCRRCDNPCDARDKARCPSVDFRRPDGQDVVRLRGSPDAGARVRDVGRGDSAAVQRSSPRDDGCDRSGRVRSVDARALMASREAAALLKWRWTPTAEERLLAQVNDEPISPPPASVAAAPEPAATVPVPPASAEPISAGKPAPTSGPNRNVTPRQRGEAGAVSFRRLARLSRARAQRRGSRRAGGD